METTLIKETKQEAVDSARMREDTLRQLLKEQNYPRVLSYTCSCCWNVMRIQRRSLSMKHIQWLMCLRTKGDVYTHHSEIQQMCYKLYKCSVSDYPALFHTGLITENPQMLGYYKVSEIGLAFLLDKYKVKKSYYQVPNSDIFIRGSKTVGVFDLIKDLKNYIKIINN